MKKLGKLEWIRRPLLPVMPLGLMAFAAVLTARADYPSVVTNLNPVGYWRLNQPAATVGSRVTGTATNYGSGGAAGNGEYYSITNVGVDPSSVTGGTAPFFSNPVGTLNPEYVEVPTTPALLTNTSMSIECWVLRTNFPGTGTAISGGVDTGAPGAGYSGFILFLDNAAVAGYRNYYLRVRYSTNGNGTVLGNLNYNCKNFGTNGTPLGQWDHVVYTWDQTTLRGYINGFALNPATFPAGQWYHPNATLPIRIGSDSRVSVGNLAINTWLAHVAIYTNALTYDQVTNHLAATNSVATYKSTILADKPAGYWPLNESGPLAPPSLTPVTCTNFGSWGPAANGTLNAVGTFNTGASGVPYLGFGGATCAYFSGTGSKVLISPQTLASSDFTFAAWAKIPSYIFAGKFLSVPTDSEFWFGNSLSASPGMYNNMLACTFNGGYGSGSALHMPSNQWAFVAWVHSASESTVYVNGLGRAAGPAGSIVDFSVTNILVGDNFSGWFSDVALFYGAEVN